MKLRQQIPNTITLLNLMSGSAAVILALDGQLKTAALLTGLAAVFDFFDGFSARLLHVKSEVGKELDSLADVISFGLVPGIFLFIMLRDNPAIANPSGLMEFIPYLALLIPAFSGFRLAKFNLDTRQTDSFLGLPTPANALFIIPLALISGIAPLQDAGFLTLIAGNLWFQLILIPVSCWLLISEIPLFAMKFSNGFGFSGNKLKYIFLALAVVLLVIMQWASLPVIVVLYVLLSVFFPKKTE